MVRTVWRPAGMTEILSEPADRSFWACSGQLERCKSAPKGAQSGFSGMIAAHSVDASSGRGGGGAEINLRVGSCVGAQRGPEEDLARGHRASAYIAANEVGVGRFEVGRGRDAAVKDAVAEAGSQALDLVFDALRHINR